MPENRKILLIGAGGHCKSVLDSLISLSCYDVIRLVDKVKTGIIPDHEPEDLTSILKVVAVVGDDNDLERLYAEGYTDAFITIGSVGDITLRNNMYLILKQIGFHIPNIIDKSSIVSPFAVLGEGVFIGKNAVVNAEARIGNCTIINSACVIEHECTIGDFVHCAPGSILCGKVHVEAGSHIGAGSVIKQGIHIGADCMIGMGSVVLKNIRPGVIAFGNPCKEVEL